jgi:CBS domain containing-hemolysin-like protein
MFGAGAAAVSQKVYLPLGIVLGLIGNVMQRVLHALGYKPAEHTGREKLLHYFEAVAAEDILSQEQHQMVQRILEAEDQTVRHVMLPLQKALLINEDSTCEAAASIMLDAGYNRAALTDKSGTPTGKLITLNAIMRNPASIDQPVYQLSLPLISIDANTRAGNALRRLQKENCRMAIATGKSGKPVGLITVSLLLGRVVGALRL